MSSFLDTLKSGYGLYIWPAYGVSAFGILAAIAWTVSSYNKAKARVKKLEEAKRA